MDFNSKETPVKSLTNFNTIKQMLFREYSAPVNPMKRTRAESRLLIRVLTKNEIDQEFVLFLETELGLNKKFISPDLTASYS